jgi:putative transcriptional regulator
MILLKYQTIEPGDIIVSSPYTNKGLVFNKSVVLIMSHDKNGTSGIIINKLLNALHGKDILKSLQLSKAKDLIQKTKISSSASLSVFFGGPLEQEKGIILHSSDYKNSPSINVTSDILISTSSQIITDILSSQGPLHKMLVLGYAGWSAGQLTEELKRNDWLLLFEKYKTKDSKEIFNLLFLEDDLYKWNYALSLAGINSTNYLGSAGNA